MAYKVFLVEDEITTREGIRDNVDWRASGFELCGEASDGEIALSQIEATQPDVLITDIKMPFMDGLQLCKIIREHMSWMKIIIISGYNEFSYAQQAIQLGVTEYLLKPVSVQDLQAVLAKVAVALDQEKSERAYLKRLRSQVEDNLVLLREKFLLRLVTGGESSSSAFEQSQQFGLDVLAPFYQVILLRVRPAPGEPPPDYNTCQQVEKVVAGMVSTNMDTLLTKKGLDEFVLILKGESPEQLAQEGAFLAGLIQEEVVGKTGCQMSSGLGAIQQRLGDLHRSYVEALLKTQDAQPAIEAAELRRLDHAALHRFFETAQPADFDAFYDQHIRPIAEAALQSNLLKHYVIVDIALTAAQFLSNLGGSPERLIPARYEDATFSASLKTQEQIRAELSRLFGVVLAFRDQQASSNRAAIIQQARAYIAGRLSDSKLSLNEVAGQVNFSPNHFSMVFSSETGETFRDYLTRSRIEQAKKLLRGTRLKCAEVAFQCGYNDPHYFSVIFRKQTGLTPHQYRNGAKGKSH